MTSNKAAILIQSLQDPALFPHNIDYFKLIETHISWVLLTGQYAYKIKKPLNLGFLDFSSLEKRKFFCYEELRLNSRLAKDIYLEVIAITGTEDKPSLDNNGTTIEYAVKMRQFEADKTFDHLLTQSQLTVDHLKQTAETIAAFHNRIEKAATETSFGNADMIMQPVRDNFSQILQLDNIEKVANLNRLALWSEQQHTELLTLFKQRKLNGFIRECHGDLHLRNIALIAGQVVPFDGIDFNPTLYWIDVICDIAFLVMDLQNKQRHDLAFQFLNSYLQHSGDYAALKLLRFYLVYRAIVMAKVSAIRANQRASTEEYQLDMANYHVYIKLATSYIQTAKPMMIIMHGVSGSGKSWLSEQIISRFQAIRLRSDVERKRLQILSTQQKSRFSIAQDPYSQASTDMTYQHLLQLAIEILSAGYHVIVDATFLQQHHRKIFFQQAEQQQTPFLIINTQTDKDTLVQRIKDRAKRQDNVSEADPTVLDNQLDYIQPLCDEELNHRIVINTDKTSDISKLWTLLNDY